MAGKAATKTAVDGEATAQTSASFAAWRSCVADVTPAQRLMFKDHAALTGSGKFREALRRNEPFAFAVAPAAGPAVAHDGGGILVSITHFWMIYMYKAALKGDFGTVTRYKLPCSMFSASKLAMCLARRITAVTCRRRRFLRTATA